MLTTGGHSAGPAARLTGGTRAPLRSRRPGGCTREAPARSRHGLSPDDDPNLTQTEREKRPWTHETQPGGRTRTESGSAGTHSLTGPAPSRSPRTRHGPAGLRAGWAGQQIPQDRPSFQAEVQAKSATGQGTRGTLSSPPLPRPTPPCPGAAPLQPHQPRTQKNTHISGHRTRRKGCGCPSL